MRTGISGLPRLLMRVPAVRCVDLVDLDVLSWRSIPPSFGIDLQMVGIGGNFGVLVVVHACLTYSASWLFSLFLMIDV